MALCDARRFFGFARNDTPLAVRQLITGTPEGPGVEDLGGLCDARRFFDFAQNDTSLAARQPIVGTPKCTGGAKFRMA